MFISCGQDEPLRSPQKAYFSCVIAIYFVSFFYEHPVFEKILWFNFLFMWFICVKMGSKKTDNDWWNVQLSRKNNV